MSTVMAIRVSEQGQMEEKQTSEISQLLASESIQKEALCRAIESKNVDEQVKTYLWLGNFYLTKAKLIPTMRKSARMKLAQENFNAIIKLNPQPLLLAKGYLGRANALIFSGLAEELHQGLTDLEDALRTLEKVAEGTPEKLQILQSALMLQGTTLAPMGSDQLRQLGRQAKDRENAINNLKQAAELYQKHPDILDPMACYEYGSLLFDEGQHKLAVEFLKLSLAVFLTRSAAATESIINKNRTYLLQAVDKTQPFANIFEKLQFCIEYGLELNKIENAQGVPLLLEAVKTGSLALVKLMRSSNLTRETDGDGNNALHYAAIFGHVDLLDEFEYIPIDTKNDHGTTPVFLAAQYGRIRMLQRLLEVKGAEAGDKRDNIVYEAIRAGQGYLLETLHETRNTAYTRLTAICGGTGAFICYAIHVNAIPTLKILLKLHPTVIHEPYEDKPLLLHAIEICSQKPSINAQLVMQTLVEAGIDLTLNGESAFKVAEKLHAPASIKNYLENKTREKETAKRNFKENTLTFRNECIQLLQTHQQKGPTSEKGKQKLLEIIQNFIGNNTMLMQQFQKGHYDNSLFKALEDILKNKITTSQVAKEFSTTFDSGKKYDRIKRFLEIAVENLSTPLIQDKKEIQEDHVSGSFEIKQATESSNLQLSPNMINFSERFERQFDDAYCYFKGVASGELASVAEGRVREAVRAGQVAAIEHLPSIPVPTPVGNMSIPLGGIVAITAEVGLYFRQRYNKKQAERMNNIFTSVTPYERAHFIRYMAEQLAFKYRFQIEHLASGSEGVERFADCCVARVVQYITSSDGNTELSRESACSIISRSARSWLFSKEIPSELRQQKSLYDTFVHGLIRVTSDFDKDVERLQTINGLTVEDSWVAKGIFENTGIITNTQERYAHEKVNLERYGYCFGTKEEAEKRNLSLVNPKTRLPWETGRKWVSQQSMAPLLSVEEVRGNGNRSGSGSSPFVAADLENPASQAQPASVNPPLTPLREMRAEAQAQQQVQAQQSRTSGSTVFNLLPT